MGFEEHIKFGPVQESRNTIQTLEKGVDRAQK